MREASFLGLVVIVIAFLGLVLGPVTHEWAWCALVYATGFLIQSWRLS